MRKLNFAKLKILWGLPIALFSLEAYFGMVLGYSGASFFSPKIKSITFNLGQFKFHLHHWLLCLWILPLVLIYKFSPLPINFSFGILGGLIFQGISSYPDWHKILIRQK